MDHLPRDGFGAGAGRGCGSGSGSGSGCDAGGPSKVLCASGSSASGWLGKKPARARAEGVRVVL
jgi:hypothetical protein